MAANGFERLFEIDKNQYISASPVILQAGVLLKNTQNGRLAIQMKFQSVSEKTITAVVVNFRLMDVTGKELLNKEYQYLDLDVKENQTFGDRTAVWLSQPETRSYAATVEQVVFADGSTWVRPHDGAQQPLPAPIPLAFSADLLRQYRERTMKNTHLMYQPQVAGGIWQCGCGAWNRVGRDICHACSASLDQQLHTDEALLQQQLDEHRQQEEEKQRQAALKKEQEEKQQQEAALQRKQDEARKKEKGKKNVITAAAVLAAVAVLVLLLTTVIIPNGHVNRGKEAFAQGNYAEAVEAFTAAGERANELKHEAAYALGDERLQKMDYDGAADAYMLSVPYTPEEDQKLEDAQALAVAQRSDKIYTTDDDGKPLPANVYRYEGKADYSGMMLNYNGLIKMGENGWVRNTYGHHFSYNQSLNLIQEKDDGLDFLYLINPENGEYVYMRDVESVVSISEWGVLFKTDNGTYGLYDLQGNRMEMAQYTSAGAFHEDGLAAVQRDGKWGYINARGEEVIPCQYVKAERFTNGYAKVYLHARKEKSGDYYVDRPAGWGLIDTAGNVVVSIEYEALQATEYEMENGVVRVRKDERWALYSLEKNKVCSTWYDELGEFSEGLAYGWTIMAGEDYFPCTRAEYIDKDGKVQINVKDILGTGAREGCEEFINGYAIVTYWSNVKLKKGSYISYYTADDICYAVMDKEGNLAIPGTEEHLFRKDNGDVSCYNSRSNSSETWSTENGVLRRKSSTSAATKTVASTAFMRQWGYVYEFSEEGIARVALNKGTISGGAAPFGYVTRDEKMLTEPVYQHAGDFHYGYAAVELDGKWGFLGTDGNYVLEHQYAYATGLLDENKTALVQKKTNGSFSLIDMTGKELVSGMKMDSYTAGIDVNGFIQANCGTEFRLYDTLGKRIF